MVKIGFFLQEIKIFTLSALCFYSKINVRILLTIMRLFILNVIVWFVPIQNSRHLFEVSLY